MPIISPLTRGDRSTSLAGTTVPMARTVTCSAAGVTRLTSTSVASERRGRRCALGLFLSQWNESAAATPSTISTSNARTKRLSHSRPALPLWTPSPADGLSGVLVVIIVAFHTMRLDGRLSSRQPTPRWELPVRPCPPWQAPQAPSLLRGHDTGQCGTAPTRAEPAGASAEGAGGQATSSGSG